MDQRYWLVQVGPTLSTDNQHTPSLYLVLFQVFQDYRHGLFLKCEKKRQMRKIITLPDVIGAMNKCHESTEKRKSLGTVDRKAARQIWCVIKEEALSEWLSKDEVKLSN